MKYIIDANNLAGKLGLLKEEDFDKKLIQLIKEYNRKKNFVLVFDSADPMGDKFKEGNIIIIYTPKDNYYKCADDKILELVEINIRKEDITVISDDRGLIEKIEKISEKKSKQVNFQKSSEFARTLDLNYHGTEPIPNDKEELDNKDIERINEELLDLWKNK